MRVWYDTWRGSRRDRSEIKVKTHRGKDESKVQELIKDAFDQPRRRKKLMRSDLT